MSRYSRAVARVETNLTCSCGETLADCPFWRRVGREMRLVSSAEIVLDDTWRDSLSPRVVRQIEDGTRAYRREFGYT